MLKLKKCVKCKMHKENKHNYIRTPAVKYSKVCNDCRIVIVGELKCLSCKKHKSKNEFKEQSYKCNICMEKRPMKRKGSDTQKCRKCNKQVKKTNFEVKESGRLSYACNRCRTSKTAVMPKVTSKKTKEVEKHRVGSYEEAHTIKLTAKEVLERAKKQEAERISAGLLKIEMTFKGYKLVRV